MLTALTIFLIAAMQSCCDGAEQASFKDKLTAYIKKDLPINYINSQKYAAYFDFTGAMTACVTPETEQTFNGLCQKITGDASNFDIYKLGNANITELTGEVRPAKIFSQLKNAQNNLEFYAPIEDALKKIVTEGRSAVLVTDFEEFTKDGQIYRKHMPHLTLRHGLLVEVT